MSIHILYRGNAVNLPIVMYNYKKNLTDIPTAKLLRKYLKKSSALNRDNSRSVDVILMRIYKAMKQRCYNVTHQSYYHYGARGINICDRWLNGDSKNNGYECFAVDMGSRPSPKHSIDRINNNVNYAPNNCRWATPKEQSANKRKPSDYILGAFV